MKIELVKFSNGKFGVRRKRLFFPDQYKDLEFPEMQSLWWDKNSKHFPYCMSDETTARMAKSLIDNQIHEKSEVTDEVIE
jgi:hypothetical protein